MHDSDFKIEKECPLCGKVELGAGSLAAASFSKDGMASLSFYCPSCSSSLTVSCSIGEKAVISLAKMAVEAMGPALSVSRQKDGGDPASSRNVDSSAAGSDTGRGSNTGHGIGISYTTLRPDSVFRFDMRLEPRGEQSQTPVELDDEQEAMVEYFHRQLESLATVDEAIEEIDFGNNLSDGEDRQE